MLYSVVFNWNEAKTWEKAEADLSSLKITRTSESLKKEGFYTYSYNGRDYKSSDLTIWGEDLSGFRKDIFNKIEVSKNHECFVNPDNPEQAYLERGLGFTSFGFVSIFAMAFSTASLFIWVQALTAFVRKKVLDSKGVQVRSVFPMVLLAGFLSLLCLPISILTVPEILREFSEIKTFSYMVTFLPVYNLTMLFLFVYLLIHHIKYGCSKIQIGETLLGSEFSGSFYPKKNLGNGYNITLICRERSRGKDDLFGDIIYERTLNANEYDSDKDGQNFLSFSFVIPYNLPRSRERGITWNLIVQSEQPGVDFKCIFDLNVLLTKQSDKSLTVKEVLKDVEYMENHPCLTNNSIKTSLKDGQLTIVLPRYRNLIIMTYALFHMAFINAFYIWGGLYKSLNIFSGFMGTMSIIVLYGFIHMLAVKKVVIVNSQTVKIYRYFLGIKFLKNLKQEEVEKVYLPKQGGTYQVMRIKTSKKDILLDKSIRSKEVVTYLKAMIEKVLWPDLEYKLDFNIRGRRDHSKAKLDAGKVSGKLSSSTS